MKRGHVPTQFNGLRHHCGRESQLWSGEAKQQSNVKNAEVVSRERLLGPECIGNLLKCPPTSHLLIKI